MAGEKPKRFVAESGHQSSPLDGLNRILDRYDDRRAELLASAPPEVVSGEEREQFALDYSAWREHGLRAALEEVGWYLEQRGHHAWLEDIGAEDLPPALETVREKTATARPLVFRVVPAPDPLDRPSAPQLRFVPDTESRRVRIEAIFGDPAHAKAVPVSVPLRLEELTEQYVIDTTTAFVRDVLFSGDPTESWAGRPGRRPASPEDDPTDRPAVGVDVGHEWSDSGITKKWLEQQRRARG
jgi:hypothetical protein